MPPRVKITKEDIVTAAVELARTSGAETVNARSVAAALNCSTQPVFSNFSNMEELRAAVIDRAFSLYLDFIKAETESGKYPQYKAFGMAYIRFAKEEKNLFKLLFMRERSNDADDSNIVSIEKEIGMITKMFSVSNQKAEQFHVKLWIWVHGVATMIATSYLDWDFETISAMLTDVYNGLKDGVNK